MFAPPLRVFLVWGRAAGLVVATLVFCVVSLGGAIPGGAQPAADPAANPVLESAAGAPLNSRFNRSQNSPPLARVVLDLDVAQLYARRMEALERRIRGAIGGAAFGRRVSVGPDYVDATILLEQRRAEVEAALQDIAVSLSVGGAQSGSPADGAYTVTETRPRVYRVAMTDGAKQRLVDDAVEQAIRVIRLRVDPNSAHQLNVERQGGPRLALEAVGVTPDEIKARIGAPAMLEFFEEDRGRIPRLFARDVVSDSRGGWWAIRPPAIVSSADIIAAVASIDYDGEAMIHLTMSPEATWRYCVFTSRRVGDLVILTLDRRARSAPVIIERICQPDSRIAGLDSFEDASRLAAQIRSGPLPARVLYVEEEILKPRAAD